MQHRDTISTVIMAFMTQLPDPSLCEAPAITAQFIVQGKKVELVAQRVKGSNRSTWKVLFQSRS